MVEGQRGGEHRLAGLDMEERVVVRKQAVGGGAEGGIGGSQGRVGGVAPGGVATGVLVGGQSSRRGKGGSRRQGTGQIKLRGGRAAAWMVQMIKSQDGKQAGS